MKNLHHGDIQHNHYMNIKYNHDVLNVGLYLFCCRILTVHYIRNQETTGQTGVAF